MDETISHAGLSAQSIFPVARPTTPEDEERAEDVYDIPLGSVVRDAESGREYVFHGWSRNTAGTFPNFVEALTPDRRRLPIYDYHAAFAQTLERKFPDIIRFRRPAT